MLTSLGFVMGYVYFGGKGEVLDSGSTNSIRLMPDFGQNNILFAGTTVIHSFMSKPGLYSCERISLHLHYHAHVVGEIHDKQYS
jgi:hypothetical protein